MSERKTRHPPEPWHAGVAWTEDLYIGDADGNEILRGIKDGIGPRADAAIAKAGGKETEE